jgi:hypothetical protein
VADRVDELLHQFAASFPVRFAVGGDHVLVDAPGRFDLDMLVLRTARSVVGVAEPVPSRIGVRSMITVTYLSPRRVWRQQCSSTPITRTPSNRCGSSINTRLPSASTTASFAVFHDTRRPAETRATVKC